MECGLWVRAAATAMCSVLMWCAADGRSIREPIMTTAFIAWEFTAATTGADVITTATIQGIGITQGFMAGLTGRGVHRWRGELESAAGDGADRRGLDSTVDGSIRIRCIRRQRSGSRII